MVRQFLAAIIFIFSTPDSFLYQIGEEEVLLIYKMKFFKKSKAKAINRSQNSEVGEIFLKLLLFVVFHLS